MKRISVIVLFALLLSAAPATAQDSVPNPGPGPEQKNLDYFKGSWRLKGDLKASPMGPAGKFTRSEFNDWLPGDFFLETH